MSRATKTIFGAPRKFCIFRFQMLSQSNSKLFGVQCWIHSELENFKEHTLAKFKPHRLYSLGVITFKSLKTAIITNFSRSGSKLQPEYKEFVSLQTITIY